MIGTMNIDVMSRLIEQRHKYILLKNDGTLYQGDYADYLNAISR